MIKIAPSILAADFGNLADEVKKVEEAGADLLHIDIMDGNFVPNITVGPIVVKWLRKSSNLPFDTHLMINEPDKFIEEFKDAGSDILTVHVEACPHLHRTIHHIKKNLLKAGVSLNPATPLSAIEYVLNDVDMVLIMTVNPGFGGQKFIRGMLHKIIKLREIIERKKLKIDIEVDGGISEKTAPLVVKAGANVLVSGVSIFQNKNVKSAISNLRKVTMEVKDACSN